MTHKSPKIELIGAPVGEGGPHKGASLGPAALRIAGITERLESLGFDVLDSGDAIPVADVIHVPNSKLNNGDTIAGWSRSLSKKTYGALRSGAMPIVLGGDHSISIGSINGVVRFAQEERRDLFVLWIDAHADFNTPHISPTGNMHGMSAAHLCGEPGLEAVIGLGERCSISPKNLYLFGTRWIDPDEQLLLDERGVTVADMRRIDRNGITATLEAILHEVSTRNGKLHISLDLDVLDPCIAPGVSTREPCGFTEREAHLIMDVISNSGLVISIDIVELNPLLDRENKSAFILIDLLTTLLGRKIMDRESDSMMRSALANARYR